MSDQPERPALPPGEPGAHLTQGPPPGALASPEPRPLHAFPAEEEEVHFWDYWRVLVRHRWTVITFFVVTALVTTIDSFTARPVYTATATLKIDKEEPRVLQFQEVVAEENPQQDYYQTQYRLLQSRLLARRVVEKLRLLQSPEFQGPRAEAEVLAAEKAARQAQEVLRDWDYRWDVNSVATSLAVFWGDALLRGMGADLPLLRWLNEVIFPAEARLRPSDVRAGMELGCVEMLRAGITTSAEMYFIAESMVEATLAVGSRAVLASAVIDTPALEALGGWRGAVEGIDRWIDADGLRFGPGERIELAYGPHSAYLLPPEALQTIGESAQQRNALVHTHVAETLAEDVVQREEYGSVPALLEKLGVLDGRVLAEALVDGPDPDAIAVDSRRHTVERADYAAAEPDLLRIVDTALEEDLGMGDVTTDSLIEAEWQAEGSILVKEAGVLAGVPVSAAVGGSNQTRTGTPSRTGTGVKTKLEVAVTRERPT